MHTSRLLSAAFAILWIAVPGFAQIASTQSGGASAAGGTNAARARANSVAGSTQPAGPSSTPAVGGTSTVNNLDLPATDPGYHLSNGDEIAVIVWGEDDVSSDQRIDSKGIVRMPLVGEVNLSNKTVREAEKFLEQVYIDKQILRDPMITISVRDYAAREVSVLGAVNAPGKFLMPKEAASIEIVELITSVGGFKPTAKSDEVKVTRVDQNGIETVSTVDVQAMITGKGGKNSPKSFLIYPGDRIYVPERLF